MLNKKHTYREVLFQWIWEQTEFTTTLLKTDCGSLLEILDPGELNHGEGPDFLYSHIKLDGIEMHGSVEIHRLASEWIAHKHHYEKRFDSVILHVVYENDKPGKVYRSDGSQPITVTIKPYLSSPLDKLARLKESRGLLCKDNLMFIHQDAFEEQIRRATKEYFAYKVEEILKKYEPQGTISESWKNALIIQVYRTLGIPLNQDQMEQLALQVLRINSFPNSQDEFIHLVKEIAFKPKKRKLSIGWRHSGMRPASRPAVRVEQAAAFHYQIKKYSFKNFLGDPATSWKELLCLIGEESVPGLNTQNLIKKTVFQPSTYLLGQLLFSKNLMERSFESWMEGPHFVPDEIKKPFVEAGFLIKNGADSLGLAHQLKRYCRKRECHKCILFKNAIRS